MNNALKCYKFYDKQGRRLSIFGEEIDGELFITVFTCREDEHFDRKLVNQYYQTWEYGSVEEIDALKLKPKEFTIPIEAGKSGQTFIKWCRANYYVATVDVEIYYKGTGFIKEMRVKSTPDGKRAIIKAFGKYGDS